MSEVTLILGDCLEVLPTLAGVRIDAIVSDPPYGMNWNTNHTRFTQGKKSKGPKSTQHKSQVRNDDKPFDPSPWLCYPKVILWGYHHFAERLPVGSVLVWLKKYDTQFATYLSDAELAWMKGGCGVYAQRDVSFAFQDRLHPTQKPVPLMRWCLDMAKIPVGATVLDPFMGSGTTGVACVQAGINFIGIEIDETYFCTAQKRICEAQLQQRMFADTDRPLSPKSQPTPPASLFDGQEEVDSQ